MFGAAYKTIKRLVQSQPGSYRDEIERQTYIITLQRVWFFSIVGLALNLLLFYVHDLPIYIAGLWETLPIYRNGFIWRIIAVSGFVLFLLLYRILDISPETQVGPVHRRLAGSYVAFILLIGASLSLLNLPVLYDISIFTLAMLIVAVAFHLPNRLRWALYVMSLALLLAGIHLLGDDTAGQISLTTNAATVVVIAFVLERITYAYQTGSLVGTRIIEEKNKQLETALRELEFTRRRLEEEHTRKSIELDDARQLQVSMLPQDLPAHPNIDLAVAMETATEIGGDFYDFHVAPDHTLTFAIGDATGHGAQAGAMVTAAKILFAGMVEEPDLVQILRKATATLKRVGLARVYMAMALGRIRGNTLELAGAGMPPALVYRAESRLLEEVPLKGMPLGSVSDFPYQKTTLRLAPGDTVVLMSDGFPELFNPSGEMLGYQDAVRIVREAAGRSPKDFLTFLRQTSHAWKKSADLRDDMTFLVMQVKPSWQASRAGALPERLRTTL